MTQAPMITLNDGIQIPQLGLGVWQLDDAQAHASSKAALQAGYRHIDTAMIYGNETGVGRAIAESELPRNEIFITTKLWNADHGFDQTLRAFDASLKRLGLQTLDLFLIHWPLPIKNAYLDSWKAMVRLRDEGRVRSIGVSNFHQEHLQRVIGETGVTPSVNQIEIHPDFTQAPLVDFSRRHGIATESWSPLGQGGALLDEPVLTRIAARLGKSTVQVILRWHVQSGHIVIPRSTNAERIAANIDVFDFRLDAEDLRQIANIVQTGRLGPDPDTFDLGA
ncbi:oxidoreductase [Pseudomonas frederiksbergensis]|uniref:Oxidoreductase n=1 Tax=Pseudomonas frederiksbergensis TaxID=104087 RepID=A0A423K042_9PSED|nr:aldo/keto reductase [Pseudomonas frederiksbergensis]RON43605.1 oxidoreductase [Pseudomonas frederiksbergensis]